MCIQVQNQTLLNTEIVFVYVCSLGCTHLSAYGMTNAGCAERQSDFALI